MEHVTILTGPGLRVDVDGFRRLCAEAAMEVGSGYGIVSCPGEKELETALSAALGSGAGVLVCAGDLRDSSRVQAAVAQAATPGLVWLDLRVALPPREAWLDPALVANVRGRGLEGIRWAVRWLAARIEHAPVIERYGEGIEQMGDLRLPGGDGPHPVALLLHGGGWRERWERDLMDGLAVDLVRRGLASWNVEYRRVGASGGGFPGTFEDVAAAVDHVATLAERYPVDSGQIVLIGHSAGGHLAVWAGARDRLPAGAPGADPAVLPSVVLSLAGVHDLVECGRRGTDEMSTLALLGGLPDDVPERYAVASPAALLPFAVPQLLVHGTNDRPDLVDMNRVYAAEAEAAGCEVDALELPGADHFDVIDHRSLAWLAIAERLERTMARRAR